MGYVFIPREFIDAEDAKNIHIFEGELNKTSNVASTRTKEACCGKVKRKDTWRYLKYEDKKETSRNYAAVELENKGRETCGQCVATLYSDGK